MVKRNVIALISSVIFTFLLIGCNQDVSSEDSETTSQDGLEESEYAKKDDSSENNVSKNETDGTNQTSSNTTLNVAFPSQPATLDTHIDTSEPPANIANHIFETLLSYDSNGELQPMLAESWEYNEDNTKLKVLLRKGVLFHNGNEMKAEDVKASIDRWIEYSAYTGVVLENSTVEVVDDYTIELAFDRPMGTVADIFAHQRGEMLSIMPKEVLDSSDKTGVKEYVGTGPFKLKEWVQDQYIHLVRHEDYSPVDLPTDGLSGKKEALVENLYFIFISDANTQIAGLMTGEYDVIYRIQPDTIKQIESNDQLIINSYPGGELNVYYNKAKGLFTNPKAREAVSKIFDSEAILTGVYSDEKYYTLEHNLMGSNKRWYSEVGSDRYNTKNIDQAKELLEEIGYGGEEIVILTSSDFKDQNNAGIIMQQQLQEAGINAKLETYDWPTVNELRQDSENWDLHIQNQYTKPVPYVQPYIDSRTIGWTSDPKLNDIVDGLIEAADMEEATKVYEQLQDWFYDYRPITLIGNFNINIAYADYVKNLQYHGTPVFWNVSVEN